MVNTEQPAPCPHCEGTGEVHKFKRRTYGYICYYVHCHKCDGTGSRKEKQP